MKFVIVAVVSICFVAAHPNDSPSTSAGNIRELTEVSDNPRNALVHIVEEGSFCLNAALLSEHCALSRYTELADYAQKIRKTNGLFVGTGVPSQEYSKRDLHSVKEVKGSGYYEDYSAFYAIVFFQINKYGLPGHLQYISIAETSYTEDLDVHHVNEKIVGWDLTNEMVFSINELPVSAIRTHGCIVTAENINVVHSTRCFFGAFITRKGTLAGIFHDSNQDKDQIILHFIPVAGNSILMQQVDKELIHIKPVPNDW